MAAGLRFGLPQPGGSARLRRGLVQVQMLNVQMLHVRNVERGATNDQPLFRSPGDVRRRFPTRTCHLMRRPVLIPTLPLQVK